jgi:O-antigen ligase
MSRLDRRSSQGDVSRPTSLVFISCIYVATIPFDLFTLVGGRTATLPAAGLLLFAWFADVSKSQRRVRMHGGVAFVLYLYAVWCFCTTLWSADVNGSLVNVTSLVIQILVAFVIADALGDRWKSAVWTLASSSAVLAAVLLARPLDDSRGGRGSIGGADENITAFVLCIGMAAAAHLMLDSPGVRRAVYAALLMAATGAGVIYTGSRTGFLSAVGILLVATLLIKGKISLGRRIVMIVGALLAFQFFVSIGLVPERLGSAFNDALDRRDSGRADIVAMYREHFDSWAWIGIGYGADADFLERVTGQFRNAHSMFWKTWIELGLVGLVLLACVIVAVFKAGRRSPTGGVTILMLVPATLFAITLGNQTSNALWFMVALALVKSPGADPPEQDAQVVGTRRSRNSRPRTGTNRPRSTAEWSRRVSSEASVDWS